VTSAAKAGPVFQSLTYGLKRRTLQRTEFFRSLNKARFIPPRFVAVRKISNAHGSSASPASVRPDRGGRFSPRVKRHKY
jgi:hypothetical protein